MDYVERGHPEFAYRAGLGSQRPRPLGRWTCCTNDLSHDGGYILRRRRLLFSRAPHEIEKTGGVGSELLGGSFDVLVFPSLKFIACKMCKEMLRVVVDLVRSIVIASHNIFDG